MATAKIFYLLSEAGQRDSLLKGGNGKELQEITTEATPEIIKLSKIRSDGEIELSIGCYVDYEGKLNRFDSKRVVLRYEVSKNSFYSPTVEAVHKIVYFDTVQTAEQLIAWEMNRIATAETSKKQAEKDLIPLLAEYEKEKEEKRIRKEKEVAEQAARDAARETEKAFREQEKTEWIKNHGSQYLKDCLELDVKANLEYVVERAELEYPGYTVDYAETAEWDEKFSPSPEALSELKKIRATGAEAKIVWLTSPAQVRKAEPEYDGYGCRLDEEYEPCEAVVIRNYLDKYDLVKEI